MAPLAGAFGGLLASAILKLPGFGSLHTWRMIFGIEGIITVGLALISFLTLTDRPETARWLSQEEKDLAIARVKSERVGQTQVLDKIDKTKIFRGIFNPITLSTSFIFLLNNVTVQGLAFFLPTIVKTIYPKETVIKQQLYTVPPYIVGAFFTLLLPLISSRIDRRQIFIMGAAPFIMVGYIMFLASENAQVRYGATFIITASAFMLGALTNAQVSANVVSDTARSAAIGTNGKSPTSCLIRLFWAHLDNLWGRALTFSLTTVMFGNIGGLIATWSFFSWDAPNYHIGNGLNLATGSTILITATLTLFWMKRDNHKRENRSLEEELAGYSPEEASDLDWKHPGFRWRP